MKRYVQCLACGLYDHVSNEDEWIEWFMSHVTQANAYGNYIYHKGRIKLYRHIVTVL